MPNSGRRRRSCTFWWHAPHDSFVTDAFRFDVAPLLDHIFKHAEGLSQLDFDAVPTRLGVTHRASLLFDSRPPLHSLALNLCPRRTHKRGPRYRVAALADITQTSPVAPSSLYLWDPLPPDHLQSCLRSHFLLRPCHSLLFDAPTLAQPQSPHTVPIVRSTSRVRSESNVRLSQ